MLDDLNVSLVFREFVPLEVVGKHPRSGSQGDP